MSQVLLLSTTDRTRAAQYLLESWEPDLHGVQHSVLLPRTDPAPIDAELLQAVALQLQQRTARPVHLLVERLDSVPRHWQALMARLAVAVHSIDHLQDDHWEEVHPGVRRPRLLGTGSFGVELVTAAALSEEPFAGLSLAAPARFLKLDGPAPEPFHALDAWRPDLVLLDAVNVRFPGSHRDCEVAALSDDRIAIDLVAAGLYRRFDGRGGASLGDLGALDPFSRLGQGRLTASLPLAFQAEGVGARELARHLAGLPRL